MRIREFIIPLLVVLLFGFFVSCATVPYVEKERNIEKITGYINNGEVEKLEDISVHPFLFEGEILMLNSDIGILWENLAEAGVRFSNPRVIGQYPVDRSTYEIFSDSMEVETYFKKYVPQEAVVATIEDGNSEYIFLFQNRRIGPPYIYGFKGIVR